jgi:hypothetical protein
MSQPHIGPYRVLYEIGEATILIPRIACATGRPRRSAQDHGQVPAGKLTLPWGPVTSAPFVGSSR